MNEAEFKAVYERLDAMGRRVDAVIAKEKRGRLMPVLNFKPRGVKKAKPPPEHNGYDTDAGYETEIEIAPLTARHYYLPDSDEKDESDITNDFFAGFRVEYDKMVKRQRRLGDAR
jgi:hypothetical protein